MTAQTKTQTKLDSKAAEIAADAETIGAETKAAAAESQAAAEAWLKQTNERVRTAFAGATEDLQSAGAAAFDGGMRHNMRLFELARSVFDARTAATLSVLKAGDLTEAFEIERDFARTSSESLTSGLRELSEISAETAREASKPFAERAKTAFAGQKAA